MCYTFFQAGVNHIILAVSYRADQMEKELKSVEEKVLVNPFYTNGLFLLVGYNKLGMVHCTYLGVSGYNLKKKILNYFV